jgi:hypothetical protein
MRVFLPVAILSLSLLADGCPVLPGTPASAAPNSNPEPRNIAARCIMENGGYYDAYRRKFVGAWRDSGPQAQRYNACIDRMTRQGR